MAKSDPAHPTNPHPFFFGVSSCHGACCGLRSPTVSSPPTTTPRQMWLTWLTWQLFLRKLAGPSWLDSARFVGFVFVGVAEVSYCHLAMLERGGARWLGAK